MLNAVLQEATMTADTKAITETVQLYLDGLYEGDAGKLAQAFHPTSSLASEDKGVLTQTPREQWLERVRNRPSGKSQGLARKDEILQIDQSSPTTAFVKLKCQLPPRFFTDYLLLLKVDGRWQVAQKTFTTEVRE
jgi:hypothetical protein